MLYSDCSWPRTCPVIPGRRKAAEAEKRTHRAGGFRKQPVPIFMSEKLKPRLKGLPRKWQSWPQPLSLGSYPSAFSVEQKGLLSSNLPGPLLPLWSEPQGPCSIDGVLWACSRSLKAWTQSWECCWSNGAFSCLISGGPTSWPCVCQDREQGSCWLSKRLARVRGWSGSTSGRQGLQLWRTWVQ